MRGSGQRGVSPVSKTVKLARLAAFVATTTAGLASIASGSPPSRPHERLIIRLDQSINQGLEDAFKNHRSIDSALGIHGFDSLSRKYGLRTARTLRRVDAQQSSVASRRQAEAARRKRLPRLTAGRRKGLPSFASTYVLALEPSVDIEEAARDFASVQGVVYAEADRIRRVNAVTNDPFLSSQGAWGQSFPDLWGLQAISAPAAWDISQGAGVVVAVIDTGIDVAHPDLAANVWINAAEVPGNSIDDDGNGFVDDVIGWNFVADSNDPQDDYGHGTHVAGTIAAVGNNGIGVVGVAYASRVMAVKAIGADGSGYDSDLADAILYAVENGARVINASWGGYFRSQTLDDAIEVAHAAGVVFVAAAGNDSVDIEGHWFQETPVPFEPAANPETIAVAATDHLDQRAVFSNYGHRIDLAAPGGGGSPTGNVQTDRNVLSLLAAGANTDMTASGQLIVAGSYLRQAGTSMSAPHVSGAAAVLLAARPTLSPEQVRAALRAGADDVDEPGFDLQTGYGRLNVAASLAIDPLEALITSPTSRQDLEGETITIAGSARGAGFHSYHLERASLSDLGRIPQPTDWVPLTDPVYSEVDDAELAVVSLSGFADGANVIRLVVESDSGTTFEDRVVVTVDRLVVIEPKWNSVYRDGVIQFIGKVAPVGFEHFSLEYYWLGNAYTHAGGLPTPSTDGITLVGDGDAPVAETGLFATFDTSVITEPHQLVFRLTAIANGQAIWADSRVVIVDPTLKSGWPQVLVPYGPTNYPPLLRYSPVLADLDGDGTTEVLVHWGRYLNVYEPDGSSLPGFPFELPPDPIGNFFARGETGPSAADLDGDGDLEMVLSRDELLFVVDHHGEVVPGWPIRVPGLWDSDCTLADLDSDGLPEIIVGTASEAYPDGTPYAIAAVHAFRLDGSELAGFPTSPADRVGFYGPISAGDIDGDGKLDLVAKFSDGTTPFGHGYRIWLYVIDSQGVAKRRLRRRVGTRPPWNGARNQVAPTLADLNGDGVLDIAFPRHGSRRITAYRGNGKRIRVSYKLPRYKRNRWDQMDPLTVADITGDGIPDLVTSTNLNTFALDGPERSQQFLNVVQIGVRGDGTLPGWPISLSGLQVDFRYGVGAAAIGDIDGDGQREVVVNPGLCHGTYTGRQCFGVLAFHPDGSMVPGFPKPTADYGTSNNASPAIGDLDGDGTMEIVAVDALGNVYVWEVPGSGATPDVPWPMARQNAAHTGALPVAP